MSISTMRRCRCRSLRTIRSLFLALFVAVILVSSTNRVVSAHESCCKHKQQFVDEFIVDLTDLPPDEFEGQRRIIADPASIRPDYWDDEDDGPWEPDTIVNPHFHWHSKKMIRNPNYVPPPTYWNKLRGELKGAVPWITLGVILTAALAMFPLPLERIRHHLSFTQQPHNHENRVLALLTCCIKAALIGLATPLCSCGALPIAAGFVAKGVPLSSALAFLTASQSAGLDSAAITWGLLGPTAALCRLAGAVVLAVAAGMTVAFAKNEHKIQQQATLKEDAPAAAACRGSSSSSSSSSSSNHGGVNETTSATTMATATSGSSIATGALTTLTDTTWEILPMVLTGLAISTAVVHYLPSLGSSYESLQDQLTHLGRCGPLIVRLGVLVSALPLQLCEHTTVTLAAGIQKAGGSPGLAFAFLLSAPATNLPSLLLLLQDTRHQSQKQQQYNSNRTSRFVVIQVALALSVAALLLSYLVDALGVDMLVEKEADADAADGSASSMASLPGWFVKLSPYIIGTLAVAGIVNRYARMLAAIIMPSSYTHSKHQDHSPDCCTDPAEKEKTN